MQQFKLVILLILFIPKMLTSQVFVIDKASNYQLKAINKQTIGLKKKLIIANKQLEKLNAQQSKSNEYLKKLSELKEEEIETYKNAPDNRLISYQKQMLTFEKKKIIEQIKTTISSLREMKYVSEESKTELKNYLKNMALQVAVMWKQTSNVITINDKIIPASERQTLLEKTISVFSECVSDIEDKEIHLNIMNKEIKSRKELFGF